MLYPDLHNNVGLIKSTLGLVVTVDSKHFQKGTMHLKCVASVSPVLWRGGKESIVQWRAPSIDNREAMLYGKCEDFVSSAGRLIPSVSSLFPPQFIAQRVGCP